MDRHISRNDLILRPEPPGWFERIVARGLAAGAAAAAALLVIRVAIGVDVLLVVLYITGAWNARATQIARREVWVSLKVAAYPLVGNRVFRAGFDPPIVSLAVLNVFGFSLCLGVLFAFLSDGKSRLTTILLGLVFGTATSVFDLAFVNPAPATALEALPSGFAMALALLWYQRRFPPPSATDATCR